MKNWFPRNHHAKNGTFIYAVTLSFGYIYKVVNMLKYVVAILKMAAILDFIQIGS